MAAGKNDRTGVTLVGEEYHLLQEMKTLFGDGVTNPKIIGICMRQTLERRTMIMRSWSQLMIGVTQSMKELGLEEEFVRIIEWFNGCGQLILTNRMSSQEFLQIADKVDTLLAEQRRAREAEAEEELRSLIKEM